MYDLTTLGLFAEYLLGLYFIGASVTMTYNKGAVAPASKFNRSVDWFKLVFGFVLLLLAIFNKVA